MAPIATIEMNGASNRIGALHEQTRRASTGQVPGEVDTEFFIVGAGPAGASLACFLANYGRHLF
jgi:NADH dehydrogenase FAD-containing subunit